MKVWHAALVFGALEVAAQAGGFEITPDVRLALEDHAASVRQLAAEPVIVQAVVAQNRRGPLAGMTKSKWRRQRRRSEFVTAFQKSPAGQRLRDWVRGSRRKYSEAFLSARAGEKVAFYEKTTSYIHRGNPKFDVPFDRGEAWFGAAEFDESSQTYQVQVAVPVVRVETDAGAAGAAPPPITIGVLVVGVTLDSLENFEAPD